MSHELHSTKRPKERVLVCGVLLDGQAVEH